MSKVQPKITASLNSAAAAAENKENVEDPPSDMIRQNATISEDVSAMQAAILAAQKVEAERAFKDQIKGRKFSRTKAKQLGIIDDPEFKAACAPYLKTRHEFEFIDDDKYKDGKVSIPAHTYGACIHCGAQFTDVCFNVGDTGNQDLLYFCNERQAGAGQRFARKD